MLQRIDLARQVVDQLQPRVLVGLRERDVESDDLGAVARQRVDERGDPRPRPRPAAFDFEALLVDHRQHDRRAGRDRAAGAKAQIQPVELDRVQDGGADDEQAPSRRAIVASVSAAGLSSSDFRREGLKCAQVEQQRLQRTRAAHRARGWSERQVGHGSASEIRAKSIRLGCSVGLRTSVS